LLALLVARLGVNVPYWDEWEFVTVLQKSAAHMLRLGDLWAQHNEHRHLFPQIILLGLSHPTHWDVRAELAANLVLAVAAFAVLAFLLRRTVAPYGRAVHLLALGAFAWLLFSPVAWENWLWGWELSWFLDTLAVVAAVAILAAWPASRPAAAGFACAVVAAVVASYSLAGGLLVWPACLALFVADRRFRRFIPIWLAAAAATVTLFLRGYVGSESTGNLHYVLEHPVAYARYALTYLGAPLSRDPSLAPALGLLVLAVFAAAVAYLALRSPRSLGRAVPWVALGGYAVMAALMTGLGRAHFGTGQSIASRYTTLSVLLPLAAIALALTATGAALARPGASRPAWVGVRAAVGLALVPVVVGGWITGWKAMDVRHALLAQGLACLEHAGGPADPCLRTMYPDPTLELARLRFLESSGLTALGRTHRG
jgi:hypothetical protein